METRFSGTAGEIARFLERHDTEPVDIPVLQPADPFLDMAGEDLRSRIFLTESETGDSLCLRPEFTIPVCRDHIAKNARTPRRYGYLGEVFRQRREGGTGFLQAGIEDLGDPDRSAGDARSIADAHALLRHVLPQTQLRVTLGDQAVFDAVLAALGLPRGWHQKLARAFGTSDQLESALAELAGPRIPADQIGTVGELAASGEHAGLESYISKAMEEAGLPLTVGRSASEIAARMIEKQRLSAARLSADALEALRAFLAIRVPLKQASEKLDAFAADTGLDLEQRLEGFESRVREVEKHAGLVEDIIYDGAFGRALDYYTGLVFEIAVEGSGRPLIGGGRYDRLLTMLGSDTAIPGVGFSVWLDRVDMLAGEA